MEAFLTPASYRKRISAAFFFNFCTTDSEDDLEQQEELPRNFSSFGPLEQNDHPLQKQAKARALVALVTSSEPTTGLDTRVFDVAIRPETLQSPKHWQSLPPQP